MLLIKATNNYYSVQQYLWDRTTVRILWNGNLVGHTLQWIWFKELEVIVIINRAAFVWPWQSVRYLFHEPMFGKIKTKLLLIPSKETPNMGSKHFNCPITLLHFKWRQSLTFQKVPWRNDIVCIRVHKANENSRSFVFFRWAIELNALHFCLCSVFRYFPRSYESHSILPTHFLRYCCIRHFSSMKHNSPLPLPPRNQTTNWTW